MPETLVAGKEVNAKFKNLYVWTKDNAGMGNLHRSRPELVFLFKNN